MDPDSVNEAISGGSGGAVAILGVMIPIVAIVMGLGLGMLKLWLDFRRKRDILQAHHAERMAAIDKGIELPPLPPQFYALEGESAAEDAGSRSQRSRAGSSYLRSGLTWLLVGLAISIALYADQNHSHARNAALWGLVPAAYGLARLLFYLISSRAAARVDAHGDPSKPN